MSSRGVRVKAVALAEKLFGLDQVIFERADDSNGVIGYELREASVLWLEAAAAVRARSASARRDWLRILWDLYQSNDYGVREPLLQHAHRLLREEELRALAARFEADARQTIGDQAADKVERYRVFSSSSAMGLVARALRDPKLYEQCAPGTACAGRACSFPSWPPPAPRSPPRST